MHIFIYNIYHQKQHNHHFKQVLVTIKKKNELIALMTLRFKLYLKQSSFSKNTLHWTLIIIMKH